MLKHGFRGDRSEYFAGETTGLESGRNDAENFTRHTRSYHEKGVLDSEKKGKLATMLPSRSNLLIWSALFVFAGATSWGQANLETRAKPGAKIEPRPQANIKIDSTLVLI